MAQRLFLRRSWLLQGGLRPCSTQPTNVVTSATLHKTPSKIKKTGRVPKPVYGGRHIVTMLPGNGIGPEMTTCVKEVFATAQVPVDFEVVDGSGEEVVKHAVISIRRNRVAIKGNLSNVIEDDGFIAPNVSLRTKLDLFVYVIHYKGYSNVPAKVPNLNVVLIRQNTEGEYAMLEHESVKGVVESMKVMTRDNTKRLARFAFEHAVKHGRRKLTVVHRSRQFEISDGLFLGTIKEVARDYPNIQLEDIHIDKFCMKLLRNPAYFDVLLMPNLYGQIASNIICGLVGGAGLFSGINYGEGTAIFETATRHTGESLYGKNIANPVAMLNASVNLLRHLGKDEHARIISDAIHKTLSYDKFRTPDIQGDYSTRDVIDHIKEFIVNNMHKYNLQF